MNKPEFEKDVIGRLSNLEAHLVNFILPLQQIHSVADRLNKPIVLDDRVLINRLREFREGIDILINFFKIIDINEITQVLNPFIANLEKLNHTFGEIKFIGKRLNEIEKTIEQIKNDGVDKKVRIDLTLDGYEMCKKKIKNKSHEEEWKLPDQDDHEKFLQEILSTLSERESKVLIHRFGLFGEKKKALQSIGTILGVSRERIGAIQSKALRKLRMREGIQLITHLALREAVLEKF